VQYSISQIIIHTYQSFCLILVSEAARKALWTCLVDEPTLLIRFFFEKLSQKERRVSIFFN